METRRPTPLRILAPIALVVFALALIFVVATSGGGDDEGKQGANSAEKARDLGTSGSESRSERRREREAEKEKEKDLGDDVYVVKEGDTLGDIAEETGVPVERLEELNPGLDQFSLVAGQRIKLR